MNGIKPIDLRWSDLDPVGHLKHSVYYDLAASQRIGLLHEVGLGIQELAAMGFGPVLFKEVCTFRREIRSSDQAHITAQLIGLSDDLGRFAFRHEFFKGEVFCARLEVLRMDRSEQEKADQASGEIQSGIRSDPTI